jgi:hypothetical protein
MPFPPNFNRAYRIEIERYQVITMPDVSDAGGAVVRGVLLQDGVPYLILDGVLDQGGAIPTRVGVFKTGEEISINHNDSNTGVGSSGIHPVGIVNYAGSFQKDETWYHVYWWAQRNSYTFLPSVYSITPNPIVGGNLVTIKGDNIDLDAFGPVEVYFGNTFVASTFIDPQTITFTAPVALAGQLDYVRVIAPAGSKTFETRLSIT